MPRRPSKAFWTPDEIAERWQVNKRTVYLWMRDGRLNAVRLGDLFRVPADEVARVERLGLDGGGEVDAA